MSLDLNHAFALAAGPDAAKAVFAYARAGVHAEVGSLCTTASLYDVPNMRSRRVWTDNATAWATGSFKRLDRNRYFDIVMEGKQPFSSLSIDDLKDVFFDWDKIESLGYGSNMNLPAIANGEVIGSMNLLNITGHYTAERVATAMRWQPVVTLAFLLLIADDAETATFHGVGADLSDHAVKMEGF